jgi:hypothetical protein
MVYQETNIQFNTNKLASTPFGDASGNDASGNDASGNDPWFVSYNNSSSSSSSNVCQGSNCCSTGMAYNSSLNQCVESFQTLSPATTPSLNSLSSSSSIPSPVLGDINKMNTPLISRDLNYNNYKNTTNKNLKNTSSWDTIMSSLDQLLSNKKPDYTMGMNSLSSYNS